MKSKLLIFIIFAALLLGFFLLVYNISKFVSVENLGEENLQDQQRQGKQKIREEKIVTKIIDGDTLIVEGGERVRLLGIDSDERGYPCYNEAKTKLEELVLSKKVTIESSTKAGDKDQYDRLLRYIFLDGENINIKLVSEGLAIARIEQEDNYKKEIVAAEQFAIQNKVGCKWNTTAI